MRILPRGFGQVLNDAIAALGRMWRPLLVTGLISFVPATIATFIIYITTGALDILVDILDDPTFVQGLSPEELDAIAGPLLVAVSLALVVQAVATLFVFLVAHRLVLSDYRTEEITGGFARREALRIFGPALAAGLVSGLLVVGSLIAAILIWGPFASSGFVSMVILGVVLTPGVWMAVSFSILSSVVSFERRRLIDNLTRAITLVKGRWGATFGFLIMVGLLGSLAMSLILWILPIALFGGTGALTIVVAVGGLAAEGLIVGAMGVAYTHWYIDLRSRAEAVIVDQL